jgi:POT family proton-dependent oligopeptide transporter
MEHANQLSHRTAIFTISASRLFERAAYYGLRAILVIYMLTEAFDSDTFSREEALQIYGIFTGVLIFTQIIGALIGDFLTGSKVAMIIGIFVQALGAFVLSISSTPFLFAGLGLVLIGGGLYSPNVMALFAKQYSDRKKLADSGFMLFYIAINIGAFFGILLLSYLSEEFRFSLGFIASGILFLCAGVLAVLSKDDKEIPDQNLGVSITVRSLNVFAAIATTGLFWWLYELFGSRTYEIQSQLNEIVDNPMTRNMWQHLNTPAILFGGIILVFVWSKIYTSLYIKIAIGFLLCASAMLLLYFFPPAQSAFHIILFGGIMLLFAVAELFISPAVLTAVARYVNPKYMGIAMSATFIPGLFFRSVSSLLGEVIYSNQDIVLLMVLVIATLVGIGMFALHFLIKDEG